MGSSGSGGVEDCSVGSIVWVRRRNGSWWPGKILRPDELSATHLMSPRSGTPVKLLGREDASVDWYNLEKSKRVKAFRCGEFDECIERAESSQGMPAKKREKYARREDAILHALELEKQLLEKEQGEVGIASDSKSSKLSDSIDKELITSSESLPYRNGKLGNAKPDQLSTSLDSFLKDEKGSSLYAQKAKEGNQLDLEDNNSETIPQTRGLQDFELGTAPLKRKFSSVTSNGSQRPAADDHAHAPSYGGVSMEGTSHANNNVDIRKKSNGGLTEDILVKRRDKRRPLDQVLQTSAELPASPLLQADSRTVSLFMSGVDQIGDICRAKRSRCMYLPAESSDCLGNSESAPKQMEMSPPYMAEDNCQLPGSLMEENTSGFTEDEESESSETEDLETDSDGETNALSDADLHLEAEAPVGSEVQGKHGTMDDEELDELALSDDLSHLRPHYPASANAGVSKWKMKGKRNVRYLTKKLGGVADVKGSTGFVDGTYMEEKGINFSRRPLEHTLNFNQRSDAFSNDLPESGIIENRQHTLISKAASKHRNRNGLDIIDWEDLAWEETSFRGYLDTDEYLDPVFVGRHRLGGRTATTLIDVDLKVQASYKKEHVPIVSLMSKVDGKAIIGHPIQIEALKEGSSEIFFSENDFGYKAQHNEGDTTLPPVWRTGRRTANSRVPRPHPSSALENDEAADHLPLLGHERRPPLKKPNGWGFTQKGSLMKKGPHIPRPQTDGKFSRKLPKKVSLSSSQKTRTLSSIGMEQKFRDPKHYSDGYSFDGLIKPVSGPPTTVACIPIKLVFSRLYEAVGRQPSRLPS